MLRPPSRLRVLIGTGPCSAHGSAGTAQVLKPCAQTGRPAPGCSLASLHAAQPAAWASAALAAVATAPDPPGLRPIWHPVPSWARCWGGLQRRLQHLNAAQQADRGPGARCTTPASAVAAAVATALPCLPMKTAVHTTFLQLDENAQQTGVGAGRVTNVDHRTCGGRTEQHAGRSFWTRRIGPLSGAQALPAYFDDT